MITNFELRNAALDGIFIGFDTEREAMRYWHDEIEHVSKTHLMHGAVVVRHSWESNLEAETARLDFLLSPNGITKYMSAAASAGVAVTDDLVAARKIVDALRGVQSSTVVAIWPPAAATSA